MNIRYINSTWTLFLKCRCRSFCDLNKQGFVSRKYQDKLLRHSDETTGYINKTQCKKSEKDLNILKNLSEEIDFHEVQYRRVKTNINVLAPPELPEDIDIIKPVTRPSYTTAALADK